MTVLQFYSASVLTAPSVALFIIRLFAAVDYTDFRSSYLCILECKLNVFLYWQNNETEIELQVTFLLSLITM